VFHQKALSDTRGVEKGTLKVTGNVLWKRRQKPSVMLATQRRGFKDTWEKGQTIIRGAEKPLRTSRRCATHKKMFGRRNNKGDTRTFHDDTVPSCLHTTKGVCTNNTARRQKLMGQPTRRGAQPFFQHRVSRGTTNTCGHNGDAREATQWRCNKKDDAPPRHCRVQEGAAEKPN